MSRDTDHALISQIFLSATAQDCKEYRETVRDFVEGHVREAKIFLQEDWAEGGNFVVEVCRRRVRDCDAYFGLFGHRYGWVPPGHTKSITELEFLWAAAQWSSGVAPIFVLLPEKGSEADSKLQSWAEQFHEREFPDLARRAEALETQRRFLHSVVKWAAEGGRCLVYYKDCLQLVGKALSCVQNWNQDLLRRAMDRRRKSPGHIPEAELGRLFWKQRTVLSAALESFRAQSGDRAACFLVHGAENHGQRQFADFLTQWDEEWEDSPVFLGQAADPTSVESAVSWVCGQLKEPLLGTPTIAALAELLATRLPKSSVILVFRTLGNQTDRLAKFQEQFWHPLVQALRTRTLAGNGRLYGFVIDRQILTGPVDSKLRTADLDEPDVDYAELLALPALEAIPSSAVQRWLKELKTTASINIPEAERVQIASRVTTPDCDPANVFDRLQIETFWVDAN